jgi:hypothetical protein
MVLSEIEIVFDERSADVRRRRGRWDLPAEACTGKGSAGFAGSDENDPPENDPPGEAGWEIQWRPRPASPPSLEILRSLKGERSHAYARRNGYQQSAAPSVAAVLVIAMAGGLFPEEKQGKEREEEILLFITPSPLFLVSFRRLPPLEDRSQGHCPQSCHSGRQPLYYQRIWQGAT